MLDIYNVDQTPTHSQTDDRLSWLTLNDACIRYTQERIEEDFTRRFKRDYVLASIRCCFPAFPVKSNFMQGLADIHPEKI